MFTGSTTLWNGIGGFRGRVPLAIPGCSSPIILTLVRVDRN